VRRRGFSLIELILAMSMLLGFLVITHMTLYQGTRYVKETDTYAYPQKEGSVVLRKLRDELSNSIDRWAIPGANAGSIRFLSANAVLAQTPHLDFDPVTGDLVWKKWVTYLWNPTAETITRYELPLQTPTSVLVSEPSPTVIPDDFPTQPGVRSRCLARGINFFQILPSGNGRWLISLTAEKQVSVSSRRNRPERVRVNFETTAVILNTD